MMKDVDGCTPMDLLADYAIGKPEAGIPTDDRLLLMLDEFANEPTEEIDVSEVVKPMVEPVSPEGEQQSPAPQPEQKPEPAPAVEPKPAENEKAPEEAKHHPTPEARPQETVPNKVTKSVLEALLRL
jgi:outer membrane biosynthesis protein TonB